MDAMYRFLLRPRWLAFHLVVIIGIVAMINFAFWQLDRLDQRRLFNAEVTARSELAVAPVEQLVPASDDTSGGQVGAVPVDELEWRAASARGVYRPDEQFLVVNRSQNGRAGYNVVTPMTLPDGRILVVNRGFVPLGFDPPEPPSGEVVVGGVLRPSEQRRTGQLSDPADGVLLEVQRIDLDRLAAQLDGPALPVYLDLRESVPPEEPAYPDPVIRPDLSEGPHLSYAVQWFIFAASVVVGWVLAVRWSVTRRRAAATASEDHPPSDDDEPATALVGTPES